MSCDLRMFADAANFRPGHVK